LNAYVPEEVISILYHDYTTDAACAAIAPDKSASAIACATTTAAATTNTSTAYAAVRACS
jgi:hypothetical protein